ncbi:MAG: hypothetical protein FWF99_00570 [Desulfovibrionaceae bacterium]|nr:hypothetical protein [Desulfovibrionaceae bacterium]
MSRGKRVFSQAGNGWLVTFADLATLLLALFVLIFSMSSVDSAILQDISSGLDNREARSRGKSGRITENLRLAVDLMADTENLSRQESRLKELLFPPEILPPGHDRGTIDQLVRIFERKEGLMFTLNNALLFMPESSEFTPGGRNILLALAPLPELLPGRISIAGHEEKNSGPDPYLASGRRALAALGVFLGRGHTPARFSVSAYGADRRPDLPEGFENAAEFPQGRLEILWELPRSLPKTGQGVSP